MDWKFVFILATFIAWINVSVHCIVKEPVFYVTNLFQNKYQRSNQPWSWLVTSFFQEYCCQRFSKLLTFKLAFFDNFWDIDCKKIWQRWKTDNSQHNSKSKQVSKKLKESDRNEKNRKPVSFDEKIETGKIIWRKIIWMSKILNM